jgi:hypothetical protein
MNTLFIILLLFNNNTGIPDIALLRNLYSGAYNNEEDARQLIQETDKQSNNTMVMGYFGAAKMLMARYYFNPFTKLNTFNNGKEILESAIRSDNLSPELRYLRLTIQMNSPSFLNYNKNIKDDKAFLSASLSTMNDEQLKTIILTYLKTISSK